MALLVDINDQSWMSNSDFATAMSGNIPETQLRFYPDLGNTGEIVMLACDRLRPGLVSQLPELELIQKLGAGVETIINDPDIPKDIRITRLKPRVVAMEMARYCLAYVLEGIHNVDFHRKQQVLRNWVPKEPRESTDTTVGVLGLGHIGGTVARLFASLDFRVVGWSRSEKEIDGVDCRSGINEINNVLVESDYVICILPSTAETTNLFDRSRFSAMKPGSTLINVGRGTLVVEEDLIVALDRNCPAKAVLDVFQQEPLPDNHPLWTHPGVTITPHISGWHLDELTVVADNYDALLKNLPLFHEVNRNLGY
jgi:glyoxylate/hydroxypyruvate reductase A